jgi:o-succinylbenzoate---CoA ligase
MIHYSKVHNKFKLNGVHYDSSFLNLLGICYVKEGRDYEVELGKFILNWIDDKDYVEVFTSGSTGKPKKVKLKKQSMVNSALATGNYFGLQPGNKALLALPSSFIAGKMMFIRALILGLEIDVINPNLEEFKSFKKYDFAALVPLQLKKLINDLDNISKLIVGGAEVSLDLKNKAKDFPTEVYETYGMTETITHIAVKRINGSNSQNEFNVINGVEISVDERNCLKINVPHISDEVIITNDIVELTSKNSFNLVGRYDNIINTGGIKISPEKVECKLENKIQDRFFIASEKDKILGNKVVLVIEGNNKEEVSFEGLEKYEVPKNTYYVDRFVETSSSKINRKETLQLLNL